MADKVTMKNKQDVTSAMLYNINETIPIIKDNGEQMDTSKNISPNEKLVIALEKHICFLQDEVRRKDAIINSLISLNKTNTSNIMVTNERKESSTNVENQFTHDPLLLPNSNRKNRKTTHCKIKTKTKKINIKKGTIKI